MKYLVLGGGGFMGSFIVDALLARGDAVRIFDRPSLVRYREFSPGEPVEWQEGDFQSAADLAAAVQGIDVVFHLVSTTLPKSSNDDPEFDVTSNVVGTIRLLDLSIRRGIRKVIFISSGGTVYGRPTTLPVGEDHPTEPIVSYGISKLAIEKYLRLYHELHGLEYAVLRVANPYGERQRVNAAQGAVAVFLHRALADQPIQIWGDGSVVRDYIHVSDVVDAFLAAAAYRGSQRVFNIGSGTGCSLNELLGHIESLLGRPVRREYLAARSFDVPASVLDITRAREVLGWSPSVSLRDGLARTIEFLQT
ncbi:MAG: NAD-dependent epimerase/dehydratase family protein [Burkholderiaceae bacterium]